MFIILSLKNLLVCRKGPTGFALLVRKVSRGSSTSSGIGGGDCKAPKNFFCHEKSCIRRFKTETSRERHFKLFHNQKEPGDGQFQCAKCKKIMTSKQAMINHQKNHRRYESVSRAHNTALSKQMREVRELASLPTSCSAPAKVFKFWPKSKK